MWYNEDMRKAPLGMYLISGIIFLFIFQVPAGSFATINSSAPTGVAGAVKEIKDDIREVDRGGLIKSSSEITKSLGDTGKKIIDTLFKPLVKVTIQISISLFKIIIGFLEYLKSSF